MTFVREAATVEGANLSVAKGIILKEMNTVNEDNFKKSVHYREKKERERSFGGTQG